MAFCLGKLGLNPGMDLGFLQSRTAVNLFSQDVGLFLITCNRTVHTHPSSFPFPIIIYLCKIYQLEYNNVPRKRQNECKEEAGERPIWKKIPGSPYGLSLKKVSLTRLGEVLDLLGHGGREEQRLALGLEVGEDGSDVLLEAHVDHSVWNKSLQALQDKHCKTIWLLYI